MSNHPIFLDVDTLTSQILFMFSLFVQNFEMINPWKFQPSIPYGSKIIDIWKFYWNGCSRVKSAILNFVFCNNYCSIHLFILKFGMGIYFGVRNPKITLRSLKNKLNKQSSVRYLRFQVLNTCNCTNPEKYMWPDR